MNNNLDYVINNNKFIDSDIIINWNTVTELTDNDYNFYKSLFEEFIIEINNQLKKIYLNNNIFDLKNIYHNLKGGALLLGLYNIAAILNYQSNQLDNNINISKSNIYIINLEFINNINIAINKARIELNNYYSTI